MIDSHIPLQDRSTRVAAIPTPLAIAGVVMLFSGVLPGGWSAGDGFLYGLLIGLAASFIADGRLVTDDRRATADDGSIEQYRKLP